MTSIDPTSRLTALLLGQMRGLGVPARAKPEGVRPGRPKQTGADASRASGHHADLATILVRRIGGIQPDDVSRHSKTLRIFLEEILLNQLGQTGHRHLLNDPAFHQMVTDVQHTMEADAELASCIAEATHLLLAGRATDL